MNNKPNVFFKIIRFVGETSKACKLPYYQEGHYLKYITRDEACCKHNLTNDELKELKTKLPNIQDYQDKIKEISKQKNNTGIWNQQGQLNNNEKNILENKIKNLNKNQLFWDTVISFDQEFANKHQLFTPSKMQEIVKHSVNKFFIDNNMIPKNMEWFFTFHTNTDNPHVHLAFFEKEPKIYNKKQKQYEYKRKGAIPISNCKTTALKIETYLDKTIDYQELQLERNKVNKQFKLAWTEAKQIYCDLKNINNPLQAKLQELIKLINFKKGKINYQKPYYFQQSELIKTKLNEFSALLINQDSNLKEKYFNYNDVLNKYQNILTEKGKPYETKTKNKIDNTEKVILPWQNFVEEQLYGKDGLYSRLGNEILKTLKTLPNIKKPKSFIPFALSNNNEKKYFNTNNLISILIKKIDNQFYQAKNQASYKFEQLQNIKIYELLNKLS